MCATVTLFVRLTAFVSQLSMYPCLNQLQAEQLRSGPRGDVGRIGGKSMHAGGGSGGGGESMHPIIMLTEESSGMDKLMRHVNTG